MVYEQFLLLFFTFSSGTFFRSMNSCSNEVNSLILYHTIPTFNDFKEGGFGKHCRKRRKCWKPAFSPFPTMFSTHPKKNFCF